MDSINTINKIEEKEGNFVIIKEKLLKGNFYEFCPNGNIVKVGNSLYLADSGEFNKGKIGSSDFVGDGNVVVFMDEKGDVIFNLSTTRAYLSTPKGFDNAGYVEKLEGKEYVLYKKVGDKRQIKLDKYSMEYFKAWEDILFYSTYDENLKYVQNNKLPGDRESIDKFHYMITLFKAVKPIYLFKYIETGDLTRHFVKALFMLHYTEKNILLEQCGDERFDKIGDPVTHEEIDFYLGEKMISEEYANQCKARIDDRLKMIQEMNILEEQKQNEIDKAKQEYAKELRQFREKILRK